jgi:hypothetical protein
VGEDYGSFTLAYVDTRRTGGIAAVQAPASIADEMTRVDFNGITARRRGPAGRRSSAVDPGAAPRGAADWRRVAAPDRPVHRPDQGRVARRAAADGAHVVTYVANDAYVVKTGPASTSAVALFAQSTSSSP